MSQIHFFFLFRGDSNLVDLVCLYIACRRYEGRYYCFKYSYAIFFFVSIDTAGHSPQRKVLIYLRLKVPLV